MDNFGLKHIIAPKSKLHVHVNTTSHHTNADISSSLYLCEKGYGKFHNQIEGNTFVDDVYCELYIYFF